MIVTDDPGLTRILETHRVIAMVGLSAREDRPSNIVARYLMARGYTVIPVNPAASDILGQRCYASLQDIPVKVDMVDVFRKAEDVPPIAAAAIAIGAKSLWLQLGIINPAAAETASAAGLDVVMDRCPKIEYARLVS
ncbi:MAG: CoA-binding protein [Rhodocyclaceae bacterium]|jgi:predicted CoA-binding protein|nr:CoA-binding protein [Rhodocyclaceae bacterium]